MLRLDVLSQFNRICCHFSPRSRCIAADKRIIEEEEEVGRRKEEDAGVVCTQSSCINKSSAAARAVKSLSSRRRGGKQSRWLESEHRTSVCLSAAVALPTFTPVSLPSVRVCGCARASV